MVAGIGLGSNVGDARANVERALERLAEVGTVVARSRLYRTQPWGDPNQPAFVNAAASLRTDLAPQALLAALKRLERALGRTQGRRWGPRVIDLDILTYGDLALDEPGLVVPHPLLCERAFALIPLAEVDPSYAPAAAALTPAERAAVVPL